MARHQVRMIYFSMATAADRGEVRNQLSQRGVGWITPELIQALWDNSFPGSSYADLAEYPPGFGLIFDDRSQTVALHRIERRRDMAARQYLLRRFWVVQWGAMRELRYNFGLLRPWLETGRQTDEEPLQVLDIPIEVEPESERLQRLAASLNQPLLALWIRLVDALSRREEPIAVLGGDFDQATLLDLTETVLLSLPAVWRPRFGFASSLCDGAAAKAAVKFMLIHKGVANHLIVDATDVSLPEAPPGQSYARVLHDAVRGQWLAEFMQRVERAGVGDSTDQAWLAAQISEAAWMRYDPDRLWRALQQPGQAEVVSRLVEDLSCGRDALDLDEVMSRSLREGVKKWSGLDQSLPNFVLLRNRLTAQDQQTLDDELMDAVWWAVMKANPEDRPRLIEGVVEVYPWDYKRALRLVGGGLVGPLAEASATSLNRLVASVVGRHPEVQPELFRLRVSEHVRAALVASLWDRLPHDSLGQNGWRVSADDEVWVVHRKPRAVSPSLPEELPPDARSMPGLEPCIVWADSDRHGLLAVRRFVPGEPLAQRIRDIELDDLAAVLAQAGERLMSLHGRQHYHGRVKLNNIILGSEGPVWVDEQPDAFVRSPNRIQQINDDRRAFKGMLTDILKACYPAAPLSVEEALRRRIASLDIPQAIEEVLEAMNREEVRKHLEGLLREPAFQEELSRLLDNRLISTRTQMDSRLQQIERQLSRIQERLDGLDARIQQTAYLQQEFAALKRRLEQVDWQSRERPRDYGDYPAASSAPKPSYPAPSYTSLKAARHSSGQPAAAQDGHVANLPRLSWGLLLLGVCVALMFCVLVAVVAYLSNWPPFSPASNPTATAAAQTSVAQTREAQVVPTPQAETQTGGQSSAVPEPTQPACQDRMELVMDVPVSGGDSLQAAQPFTKTWKVKNAGNCPWGAGYGVSFLQGDRMAVGDAPQSLAIPEIRPGETGDVVIPLTAPQTSGEYTATWELQDAQGRVFGELSVRVVVKSQ